MGGGDLNVTCVAIDHVAGAKAAAGLSAPRSEYENVTFVFVPSLTFVDFVLQQLCR